MIAKGPLGSSPRNTERIPREYSEAVTLQSVEAQVLTFPIVMDEEEEFDPVSEESIFLEEEEAQQGIMERRHNGLLIFEESPQVISEMEESKRDECLTETKGEFEEGKPEKENEKTELETIEKKEEVNSLTNLTNSFLVKNSFCVPVL
ncbi:hypothetical protein M9H77_12800 [Catharanthus roseus]|uniref:Uncharacterized protein n=1 Tax=Catharanthus roseus TaxID=4058 RepID=A0ACC0BIE8_CATRO|nr:hypothetical protein M9H77_12800 [Catharanthus roseus]